MEGNGRLPAIPLPTGSVDIAGTTIEFHALSRADAAQLARFQAAGEAADAEAFILSAALDIPREEALAWFAATPIDAGQKLLEAVVVLSGLEMQEVQVAGKE